MLGSTASLNTTGDSLLQFGVGPIAAGVAAFAIGFISYFSMSSGQAPANARLRAEGRAVAGFAVGSGIRDGFNARWTRLEEGDDFKFAVEEKGSQAEPWLARTSFGERFAFEQLDASTGSLQRSASFDDRFASEFKPAGATTRSAAAAPAKVQRVAAAETAPRAAARPTAGQAAAKRPQDGRFQLASASATSLPLSFAPTDAVKTSAVPGSALKDLTPKASKPIDPSRTAIYDITSRTVYLPNGRRLEAHSGLGEHMDDVRYVNMRMTGSTPPNVYDLKMREAPFHGVRAIRLLPTDSSKMYGRAGILAHNYLLGPSGASNGCVSFADYGAFLDAFERGEIDRLVVVERLDNPPAPKTASDWFKDFFRRS